MTGSGLRPSSVWALAVGAVLGVVLGVGVFLGAAVYAPPAGAQSCGAGTWSATGGMLGDLCFGAGSGTYTFTGPGGIYGTSASDLEAIIASGDFTFGGSPSVTELAPGAYAITGGISSGSGLLPASVFAFGDSLTCSGCVSEHPFISALGYTVGSGGGGGGGGGPEHPSAEAVGSAAQSMRDDLVGIAVLVLPFVAVVVAIVLGWKLARRVIAGRSGPVFDSFTGPGGTNRGGYTRSEWSELMGGRRK